MKLNDVKVEYIRHMGSDDTVVDVARVSFDKEAKNYSPEQNEKLIRYLSEHNHWSPFSHCFVQFRIKAPIIVARQLVKHQIGLSWNEVSRRYVDTSPEFYEIKEWRKRAENKKQGSLEEIVDNNLEVCQKVLNFYETALNLYNELLSDGVCPEQARIVLPQSMMTDWYWSGSLYAFARVCNLRLDSHSQKETLDCAVQINKFCEELFPVSWKYLVKGE